MADEFDTSMDEIDREIAERLRGALDDVEPDAAASARMLTALKDAEAMRRVQSADAGRRETPAAAAPAARPRMRIWKVATPIAAVLVVAAIGVGIFTQGGPGTGANEAASDVASEAVMEDSYEAAGAEAARDEVAPAEEDVLGETFPADSMTAMSAEDKASDAGNLAELFASITLDDGTELAVDADAVVKDGLRGKLVGQAEAFDEEGTASTPCLVYEYEGAGSGAVYAVVYDDGETCLAYEE